MCSRVVLLPPFPLFPLFFLRLLRALDLRAHVVRDESALLPPLVPLLRPPLAVLLQALVELEGFDLLLGGLDAQALQLVLLPLLLLPVDHLLHPEVHHLGEELVERGLFLLLAQGALFGTRTGLTLHSITQTYDIKVGRVAIDMLENLLSPLSLLFRLRKEHAFVRTVDHLDAPFRLAFLAHIAYNGFYQPTIKHA